MTNDILNNILSKMQNGQFSEAKLELSKELKNSPKNSELYQLLCICLVNCNEVEKALEMINKGIEINPDDPSMLSERGVVYYHLNKKSLALMDMDKAIMNDPRNPYRYSSRAFIKDSMGDTKGAILDYEKAIELDPDDSIALNNLSLLQEKLGHIEKAKSNASKADKLAKELDVLWQKEDEPVPSNEIKEKEETTISIMKKVFTDKKMFKDFLNFYFNKKSK